MITRPEQQRELLLLQRERRVKLTNMYLIRGRVGA